jgi:hypothetical protein
LKQYFGASVFALGLALVGLTHVPALAQSAQQPSKPEVPDAPIPQAPKPMSDVQVTPGIGTSETPSTPTVAAPTPAPAPRPPADVPDKLQGDAPESGGADKIATKIYANTNAVVVPVTVKDSKGVLVAGLTYRDFRIFENNQPQRIAFFSTDPMPLSIAFVIDQSVTQDVMAKVNNSLGAIQGALTPYDDVAVFAYNNGAKELTGFTGAQSHLLTAVLALNKATGREMNVPVTSGPLAGCPITSNGACVDPNLQVGKSAGKPKEVIRYLQGHKIAVYATLVGDSARWGEGYLSRFHIPFQMNDDVLPKYTQATGGSLDAERSLNGIEKSYQKIAEEARNQYTILYYSHEPAIDGRYRSIDVRVDRPSKEVEVTAKPGYYPTAQDAN